MTKQIKIPLLPLPPVDDRKTGVYLVLWDGDVRTLYWDNQTWVSSSGIKLRPDIELQGMLQKFTVQDGHMVFEVEQ